MGTSNPRMQGRGLSGLDLRVFLCGPASLLIIMEDLELI